MACLATPTGSLDVYNHEKTVEWLPILYIVGLSFLLQDISFCAQFIFNKNDPYAQLDLKTVTRSLPFSLYEICAISFPNALRRHKLLCSNSVFVLNMYLYTRSISNFFDFIGTRSIKSHRRIEKRC